MPPTRHPNHLQEVFENLSDCFDCVPGWEWEGKYDEEEKIIWWQQLNNYLLFKQVVQSREEDVETSLHVFMFWPLCWKSVESVVQTWVDPKQNCFCSPLPGRLYIRESKERSAKSNVNVREVEQKKMTIKCGLFIWLGEQKATENKNISFKVEPEGSESSCHLHVHHCCTRYPWLWFERLALGINWLQKKPAMCEIMFFYKWDSKRKI